MAWEWVAPTASGVSGTIVGVTGIVATYKAGHRQQATALSAVKAQVDGQLQGLREERRQRRLENAYGELLMMLSETYQWARSVFPFITSNAEDYRLPPIPESADSARREAIVTAAWSPRVQQLMDPWRDAVASVNNAGVAIHTALETEGKGRPSGIDGAKYRKELPRRVDAVWRADQAIREQVWQELNGDHDGSPEPEAVADQPASE